METEDRLDECVTNDSLEQMVLAIMVKHLEALDVKAQAFTTQVSSKLELKIFDELKEFKDMIIFDQQTLQKWTKEHAQLQDDQVDQIATAISKDAKNKSDIQIEQDFMRR